MVNSENNKNLELKLKIQEIRQNIADREREREREREEKRAVAFIGVWAFFTLPIIGAVYLLIANPDEFKESRAGTWIALVFMALFFILSFIQWIKVNKKMKKIVQQVGNYKKQIKDLENSIR